MLLGALTPLFAVHISDGVLQTTWLTGGFVVAVCLAVVGCWRVRDEEIPRIALLTAAFFVASSIHIRIGVTSWHLLLNGLVGVMLGRRAALAIPVALARHHKGAKVTATAAIARQLASRYAIARTRPASAFASATTATSR